MEISVLILGVVIVLGLITVIAIYNGIIGGYNRVQRAWSDVLVYERQKTKVVEPLQTLAREFKEYEAAVLEKLTGLRSAVSGLPKQASGEALTAVESASKALLADVRIAVEAYPDLKASGPVNNLMREIAEQEGDVSASITIFSRNVELFNNSIQMFPGSIVNRLLNKKAPITPFSDTESSKSFTYNPLM